MFGEKDIVTYASALLPGVFMQLIPPDAVLLSTHVLSSDCSHGATEHINLLRCGLKSPSVYDWEDVMHLLPVDLEVVGDGFADIRRRQRHRALHQGWGRQETQRHLFLTAQASE